MKTRIAKVLAEEMSRYLGVRIKADDFGTRPMADAVLDALREPTDQMIVAGIVERHDSETPEAWKLATANIYSAMIDAAKASA